MGMAFVNAVVLSFTDFVNSWLTRTKIIKRQEQTQRLFLV